MKRPISHGERASDATTDKTKPLSENCRYLVERVITSEKPDGLDVSYVLTPIAEYPLRQIEAGDVFEPVGYEPERLH